MQGNQMILVIQVQLMTSKYLSRRNWRNYKRASRRKQLEDRHWSDSKRRCKNDRGRSDEEVHLQGLGARQQKRAAER
jgi:hypothetical protein